jgi:hypothetical protein
MKVIRESSLALVDLSASKHASQIPMLRNLNHHSLCQKIIRSISFGPGNNTDWTLIWNDALHNIDCMTIARTDSTAHWPLEHDPRIVTRSRPHQILRPEIIDRGLLFFSGSH